MADDEDEGITFTIGLGRPLENLIEVKTYSVSPKIKKIPNETMAMEIKGDLARIIPQIINARGGQLRLPEVKKNPSDDGKNGKLPLSSVPATMPKEAPKRSHHGPAKKKTNGSSKGKKGSPPSASAKKKVPSYEDWKRDHSTEV